MVPAAPDAARIGSMAETRTLTVRDLDSLFQELDRDKAKAEDVFQREVAAMKDRDRLLEEKFREALKRAEEDPDEGRPSRPFDFD
jgi:hypothetical protein